MCRTQIVRRLCDEVGSALSIPQTLRDVTIKIPYHDGSSLSSGELHHNLPPNGEWARHYAAVVFVLDQRVDQLCHSRLHIFIKVAACGAARFFGAQIREAHTPSLLPGLNSELHARVLVAAPSAPLTAPAQKVEAKPPS